jgi:glycosyltransferase involved in cell wall biosynthesis
VSESLPKRDRGLKPPVWDSPADSESLPPAESLNVLMIALGDEALTGLGGDARERHIEYASYVGHLHMVVYSPRRQGLAQTAINEKLTVYPTRSVTRLSFVRDAYRLGARICRQAHIDVMTTQDPFTTGLAGVLLRRRFGVPLHVQNHSNFFDNRAWLSDHPLRHRFFNWLGKRIVRRADFLRTVNEAEKAKYVAMGIDPARVSVIPVPVRLERFTPEAPPDEAKALRAALGIPEGAPVVLWVGRPAPVKRVPLLIDAFARVRTGHPAAHLVLVGDFTARQDVMAQVAGLGLSDAVHFTGAVSHETLPSYYRLCDIYAHSSAYEGFGLVLVEAAASGRPVVSTRTAGAQTIVADGKTGLLCEVDDSVDLAARMAVLLDDPERARAMGMAGRAYVLDRFDRERTMQAIIQSWRQAASQR